eukprot:TRINITY_DN8700_c0_g1_i2.p1 TRINITY_DN8700_c0_g1~~TRINITY_DN8700_c0_g1_i2.p1  ORF type:complete len:155 (-),score=43.99 TRINITY_DN8700_c0_g1_i2:111-575(-)
MPTLMFLRRFAELDVNRDGVISLEEFSSLANVPKAEIATEIFHFLDEDDSKGLDFREFVKGLAFLSKKFSPQESVELALRVCGLEDKERLAAHELNQLFTPRGPRRLRDETLTTIIGTLDPDGRGSIRKADFVAYACQHSEIGVLFRYRQKRDG